MSPASLSPTTDPAAEEQAQASVLQTLLATTQHFFGGFAHLFAGVSDPRQPELITYPLPAVLREHCTACVRRRLDVCLSLGCAAANRSDVPRQCALRQQVRGPLSGGGLPTRRHPRRHLQPPELQAVVTGLTETLIRNKVLYSDRFIIPSWKPSS